MFFKKKKYLFPIEKPPSRLDYKSIILALIASYVLAVIFMFYIVKSSNEISQKTTDFFFNQSPDLIVVPTGDKGRISLAIEMAKQHNLSNIFITGVYKKNSLENIIPKTESFEFLTFFTASNNEEFKFFTPLYPPPLTKREPITMLSIFLKKSSTKIPNVSAGIDPSASIQATF